MVCKTAPVIPEECRLTVDPAATLKTFEPRREFFVGIDSDGCGFDTMGIKQRECFCPWMIGYFGLQPVAQAARHCKEFADLFSRTRGGNRHKTLKRILAELLPSHPQTKATGFKVPDLPHYFAWVDNPRSVLSNEGLAAAVEAATDRQGRKELSLVLEWSRKVDEAIEQIVRNVPPFPYLRESLKKVRERADIVVVSQTPCEALAREWAEHDIARYVRAIAGQEMGTKARHLGLATAGKYEKDHVLMVGDAPGDLEAAKSVGALFYPIRPGHEAASWKRFHDEAFDRFIKGNYTGAYAAKVLAEFAACLPENPPWLK